MKRGRRAAAAASTAGTWSLRVDNRECPICLWPVACRAPFREKPRGEPILLICRPYMRSDATQVTYEILIVDGIDSFDVHLNGEGERNRLLILSEFLREILLKNCLTKTFRLLYITILITNQSANEAGIGIYRLIIFCWPNRSLILIG